MQTQVWIYVVVAVLSVAAGVAIAGVPTFEEGGPTIQSPSESTTTTTTTEAQLEENGVDDVGRVFPIETSPRVNARLVRARRR